MFKFMDTVQSRLRYLRETLEGLSLRDFRDRVNAELPPDEAVSLGTLSNYERPPGESKRPGPRAGFLAALTRAFPEVRLEWLVLGEGQPTRLAQTLASPDGIEARAQGAAAGERDPGTAFAARVLERYPDLELLSPESSALFMAALTRLATGEPDVAVRETDLLELAGDLRWLLFAPLAMWGFRHTPPYRVFSDYCVAMLQALMLLMPDTGDGDPIERYADSLAAELRGAHPVGF